MATPVRITLHAGSEEQAAAAAKEAYAEIAALESMMSDYRPESELSRLHEGEQIVSEPLFEVLRAAEQFSSLSDGAFDVTVGPVVKLWRQAKESGRLPDPGELQSALSRVGWRHVVLDPAKRAVRLEKAGMSLDLGGIAKGYACDRALAVLARRGITSALVDAGGGMAAGAPPPGQKGWRIQIADREDTVVLIARCGIATSGDTERFVEIDGRRYSHVVDPRTGLGLQNRAMVTVMARDGMSADALTKVVSVLGPDKGIRIAEELPEVEAWYRWKEDGEVKTVQTSSFGDMIK